MNHFFISYAREDTALARGLAELLESEGFSVWWDSHLRMGERYRDLIRKEISRSHHVIVLWSKHSITSEWVRWEAKAAKDLNKILPIQIDGCELPHGFKTIHTVQLTGWPAFLEELYKIIGGGAFVMPSYAMHRPLAAPAEPARASPPMAQVPEPPRRSVWRWILMFGAAAFILLSLARDAQGWPGSAW
jgi:hypothetical protein